MSVQHHFQAAFNRGEITPLAHARRDLELYKSSVALLRNWIVLKHGGARRRSGSRFLGTAKHADMKARFMDYVYSTGQAFVLELGDEYIRFWTQGGQIYDGESPYEVTTTYTEDEVEDIQYAVRNDVIYLAHPNHPPRKLRRLSNTNWDLSDVVFRDGPFLPINDILANTVTPDGTLTTDANRTFVWTDGVAFEAGDVGRQFRIQVDGSWAWCTITAVTSALVVDADVEFGSGQTAAASASWQLGAFGDVPGYPAAVTFYQNRLVWAGTTDLPRALFCSVTNIPERYSPTETDGSVIDDNGFTRDITSGQADPILWLKEGSRIDVGTASAIMSVGATSNSGEVMTARNVDHRNERRIGSRNVDPVDVDEGVLFAGKNGLSIRNLFESSDPLLAAPDISVLAEHLCKKKIKRMAYQQTPDSIVWCITDAGTIFGITLERDEKVVGFHSHDFSGEVESVATIPTDDRDELWLLVKRTIGGSTVRYIELLQPPFDDDLHDKTDAFLVDCGVTYEGTELSVISGLDHLEGETLDVYSEGSPLPQVTVMSGQITLPNGRTTTKAQLGLPIVNRGVTLPAPTLASDGATLGRKTKAIRVYGELMSMLGLEVGAYGRKLTTVKFRTPQDPMGTSPPLYTGAFSEIVDDSWSGKGQIEWSCTQPTPATILALNIQVDSEP